MRRLVNMRKAAPGLAGITLLTVASGVVLSGMGSQSFPHERHANLFPTCLGCHAGIPEGDAATTYSVEPSLCAGCHNGSVQPEVDWEGPTPYASNLVFTHPEHPDLGCEACHQVPGAQPNMIARNTPSVCLSCHATNAEAHTEPGVPCAKCHQPIAEAESLPAERVAAFPRPSDHQTGEYIAAHGDLAEADAQRCSVCHARESCTRCHLNADQVGAISGLASDDRVAGLVAGMPGVWPRPASHESEGWLRAHGGQAAEAIESCATCHAQESCSSCHGDATSEVAGGLAKRSSGGPQGVGSGSAFVRPPGHTPNFVTEHGTAASVGLPECSSCHVESYCADCHDGPASPRFEVESAAGFHPANFVLGHGAEAFASQTECSACHSSEVFCRDCHLQIGIGQPGTTTGGAFHDAQPQWLISHGRAARQGLEQCTSCHVQQSCLKCHSAQTGWRVSPHGPGFDPDRVADRSTISCGICHYSWQLDP